MLRIEGGNIFSALQIFRKCLCSLSLPIDSLSLAIIFNIQKWAWLRRWDKYNRVLQLACSSIVYERCSRASLEAALITPKGKRKINYQVVLLIFGVKHPHRLTGAFYSVYNRTAVPSCDWPSPSDFIKRPTPDTGPQMGDTVAIRNKKPSHTLSPRFSGKFQVQQRLGNAIKLSDGRQVNLHDAILVGKS